MPYPYAELTLTKSLAQDLELRRRLAAVLGFGELWPRHPADRRKPPAVPGHQVECRHDAAHGYSKLSGVPLFAAGSTYWLDNRLVTLGGGTIVWAETQLGHSDDGHLGQIEERLIFQLPTSSAATVEPSTMSVRRDMPRHMTVLPGGGSLPRAR